MPCVIHRTLVRRLTTNSSGTTSSSVTTIKNKKQMNALIIGSWMVMPIHCLWLRSSPAGHLAQKTHREMHHQLCGLKSQGLDIQWNFLQQTCAPSQYRCNSYRFGPQVFLICWQGRNYGHSPNVSFVCFINKTNKQKCNWNCQAAKTKAWQEILLWNAHRKFGVKHQWG